MLELLEKHCQNLEKCRIIFEMDKESADEALMDEDGDRSPLFAQQYSIVKTILEKTPIRDLLAASRVCRVWLEVGRGCRRRRKNNVVSLLWHPYGDHTKEVFEYFNNHSVSDASKQFINSAKTSGFPSEEELVTTQSWSPLFPQMRGYLLKEFVASFWEPQVLVILATVAVDEFMPSDEDTVTKLKIILSEIPKAVPCLVSFSYGIVASIRNEPKSLEMENSEVPMLTGLLIPKVPGLVVKMFTVTKETISTFKGKVTSENCESILNIAPEDKVKGIVLFHTDMRKGQVIKEAVFHYVKKNPHVAVGGGAHYKNLASVCEGDFVPVGAGLIICGEDNVRVASVGLFDTKISKNNEQKLIDMQSCEFKNGGSFAFMFACNGRGAHMHGRTDVESSLFRKYFPKTDLIGTFTVGECCHEVIPTKDIPKPPKRISALEFAYTTVIVYVSFTNPDTK